MNYIESKSPRIFYGWIIVLVGILFMSLAYGVRYSFSVIFTSLLDQFQWSRDATAAMLSFHMLSYGVFSPIAGALVDRIGPKKTMTLGAIVLAFGAYSSSLGSELWHYYLSFGLCAGAGLGLIGTVPFTRIVSNWFVKKRGLALSLMFFGTGGPHLLYPVVALLIEKLGWRNTFSVEALIVVIILLPCIVFLVRYHPRDKGLLPDGMSAEAGISKESKIGLNIDTIWRDSDWTLSKAIRTRQFWLICFTSFSAWGISEHILLTHHIALAKDVGFSTLSASSILSIYGLFMALGAFAGFISDHIGREVTFTISTLLVVAGITALMFLDNPGQSWLLYCYSVLFGLGIGMSIPTLAASATDLFQGIRAGAAIGFVWLTFAIGGTLGPWLGGALFEIYGNYQIALIISVITFVAACISLWIAAPRRAKYR